MVIGNKTTIQRELTDLTEELNADELVVIPLIPEFKNRKHALTLLSEAFDL